MCMPKREMIFIELYPAQLLEIKHIDTFLVNRATCSSADTLRPKLKEGTNSALADFLFMAKIMWLLTPKCNA